MAVVFPRAQGHDRVRDAAGMPPAVSEPTHNDAICTSAHGGKIGKLPQTFHGGRACYGVARVAIKVDKGVGSA